MQSIRCKKLLHIKLCEYSTLQKSTIKISNTYSNSREGSNFWACGYKYVLCIDNLCAAIFFGCSDLIFASYFSKPRYMYNL